MTDTNYAAKQEELEAAMRSLGLYLEDAHWFRPGDIQPHDSIDMLMDAERDSNVALLIATFTIGDVAFSTRTLDPEQTDWDKEFRLLAAQTEIQNFDETQKLIAEKLARGENPFE